MSIEEKLLKMREGISRSFKQERWVTEQEGLLIRDLVDLHSAKSYVESGTANGFSSMWAASGLSEGGKVHTFDPYNRPKLWTKEFGCEVLKEKINFIQDGFENLGKYSPTIEHPAVIFIDGDHGRSAVLRDWETTKQLLQPGDLVLFHDLNECSVQKAFNQITLETPSSQIFMFNTKRILSALVYEGSSSVVQDFHKLYEGI